MNRVNGTNTTGTHEMDLDARNPINFDRETESSRSIQCLRSIVHF